MDASTGFSVPHGYRRNLHIIRDVDSAIVSDMHSSELANYPKQSEGIHDLLFNSGDTYGWDVLFT